MNALLMAFEITSKDIENVFERNGVEIDFDEIPDIEEALDREEIAAAALDGGTELEDQTEAAYCEIERQLLEMDVCWTGTDIGVTCSICGKRALKRTAHLHQNEWIGDECCWDDRLHASE